METNRETYTRWYNGDSELRKLYPTQNSLCHGLGVSNQLGSQFKKRIEAKKIKENGFDAGGYVQENLEKILVKTLKVIQDKGSARHIELALKLAGLLIEKREDTVKVEFTSTDRIRIAGELADGLRREWENFGICSICGQCKEVHVPILLATGREQQQEDPVATLAVSA